MTEAWVRQREAYRPFEWHVQARQLLSPEQIMTATRSAGEAGLPLGDYLIEADLIAAEDQDAIMCAMGDGLPNLCGILLEYQLVSPDALDEIKKGQEACRVS